MKAEINRRFISSARRQSLLIRLNAKLQLSLIRFSSHFLSQTSYMKLLTKFLTKHGVNIHGSPIYIAPTCWIDPTDLGLITICDNVVISAQVNILTHDYSIARIRDAVTGCINKPEIAIVRSVHIGTNSFVGFGSTLMPGATIGENCIIGAGSVIRGIVPDNSIYAGNPAIYVGDSLQWGSKKLIEFDDTTTSLSEGPHDTLQG